MYLDFDPTGVESCENISLANPEGENKVGWPGLEPGTNALKGRGFTG
jgi:hypothetical protein